MGEVTNYGDGRNLQAGKVTTDQVGLAADTYYPGMLLEYQGAGTAVTTGTGNGVASDISADPAIRVGDVYTAVATAALVFSLQNPDGAVIATGLTVPDGGSKTFTVDGLTFTLTDGSTAWVATDTIAMTIAAGEYAALAEGQLSAIYNADERILATSGYADCIMGGEINEAGLVTSSDVAIVLTEAQRAEYGARGFYIKRV